MPAATNASASPTFWQQMPAAPRSICSSAIAGHLCDFACGRSAMPRAVRRVRHQVEVALEGVEVDDERGRVDVVDGIADAGGDSLHDRHRTAQPRRARCAPLAPRPPHRQT